MHVIQSGCKPHIQACQIRFRDYDLLGLCDIDWYVDTPLPFGYHNCSALYQHFRDAVHHKMFQRISAHKTTCHDMTDIVLKVMLNPK